MMTPTGRRRRRRRWKPLAPEESEGLTLPGTPIVSAKAPRKGTKMARVIALLQRDQGATLADLIAATDWLPHTSRAALTGLRKRGYVVALDRSDRKRGSTCSARFQPRQREADRAGDRASPLPAGSPREGQPIEEVGTGHARRRGSGGLTMARRLPIDGGGSNSPPASTLSGASPLDTLVASFADLDADQLRLQWRNHLGGTPPAHLPRWLLARGFSGNARKSRR
jgi:Protein of unknown function (DUF3489)